MKDTTIVWQRGEGLLSLLASVLVYHHNGYGWLLFAVLFLAPDVSMAAYLFGSHIGANVYNLFHNFALPLALGLFSYEVGNTAVQAVALIWVAHIGFDRLLGYGLKHSSDFRDTHLGRIGKTQ